MKSAREITSRQVQAIRKEKGLSQTTLSFMVGVERSYLGKIEADNITPAWTSLKESTKVWE